MNLQIKRWDQFPLSVQFTDSTNTPFDISWCIVFFTVRKSANDYTSNDDNAVIKKNVTTHANPTIWLTTINLTETDTNQAPWLYYREIQIKFNNWDILSSMTWVLNIINDITKRTT